MEKEVPVIITEEQKKESARKISVKEGACTSAMDGFGHRYITPFALALGATNAQIAFLSSFPGLLGNFAQLGTLRLLKKRARKKIVLITASIQAVLWLPLIFVGYLYFFHGLSTYTASLLVIALYTLLIVAGAIGSPAWSSWMRDIIDAQNDGRYFSNRNKIITGVVLVAMLIAGAILQFFEKSNVMYGFAILFFLAFMSRSCAVYLFTKKYEPQYVYEKKNSFSLLQFVKHMKENNFGRYVMFLTAVSFSTAIAGPFFAVYMLKELQLSYIAYTLIILSPVVATLVFLPVWGNFSDKYGNVKILKLTGNLIPTVPLLWMFAPFFLAINQTALIVYLFILEIYSGFVWAGFNHASATFIYEAVSKEKMPYCVTYFNILTGLGIFAGSMFGGYLASIDSYPFGISPIFATFLTSGLLRILSIIFLLPLVKEVKQIEPFSFRQSVKAKFAKGESILTLQFWRIIGFIPLAPHHHSPNNH